MGRGMRQSVTTDANFRHQGMGNRASGSGTHSPADHIANVAASPLSEDEKRLVSYQYSEEMLARDSYANFFKLYGDQTFQNIAESEQKHMDAVKTLLDRYSLPVPTGYGELQSTFDSLKAEGEKGKKEALEVGLKIEMLDIEDMVKAIKATDNDDVKIVFANIGGASYNHLRGFSKALSANGSATSVDVSKYLSATELQSRGPLKNKLSERLTQEGVTVPVGANAMTEDCMSGSGKAGGQGMYGEGKNQGQGRGMHGDGTGSGGRGMGGRW